MKIKFTHESGVVVRLHVPAKFVDESMRALGTASPFLPEAYAAAYKAFCNAEKVSKAQAVAYTTQAAEAAARADRPTSTRKCPRKYPRKGSKR